MKIEFENGTHLDTAIHLAIHNSKVMKETVRFEFNGVDFIIIPSTTFEHAKAFYKQKLREKIAW